MFQSEYQTTQPTISSHKYILLKSWSLTCEQRRGRNRDLDLTTTTHKAQRRQSRHLHRSHQPHRQSSRQPLKQARLRRFIQRRQILLSTLLLLNRNKRILLSQSRRILLNRETCPPQEEQSEFALSRSSGHSSTAQKPSRLILNIDQKMLPQITHIDGRSLCVESTGKILHIGCGKCSSSFTIHTQTVSA
jgi:hypothetical protein